MKSQLKAIAASLIAASVVLLAPVVQAETISELRDGNSAGITFVNQSGITIQEIYVSSAIVSGWGNDRLGRSVLRNGHSFSVPLQHGRYDIRFLDADSDACEIRSVPVSTYRTLTITFDELMRCQAL